MSPLLIQGFFHTFIMAVFFIIAGKLWATYKKSSNLIARQLSYSFICSGLEYAFFAVTIFFASDNPFLIKLLSGIVAETLFYFAIGFAWSTISYIFPKVHKAIPLAVVALLGALDLITTYLYFNPRGVNAMGVIDFNTSDWQMLMVSVLLLATFGTIGVTFSYRTFRQKRFFTSIVMGIGFVIGVVFVPLTYQTQDLSSYIFFTILAVAGMALIVLAVLYNPAQTASRSSV